MEQCCFLDFVCQNMSHASQDIYLMMGVSEYAKLLIAFNLGVLTTEDMADASVAIIRSVRSREVGQVLYERYLQKSF